MIYDKFILTTASCLKNVTNTYLLSVNKELTNYISNDYKVLYMVTHENFKLNKNGIPENDIAILKLTKSIDSSKKLKIYKGTVKPTDKAVICGWSAVKPKNINVKWSKSNFDNVDIDLSKSFYQALLPVISKNKCKKFYGDLSNGVICAGEYGIGIDKNDHGNPLIINDHLLGIASYDSGFPIWPGIFTYVAYYENWINKIIF